MHFIFGNDSDFIFWDSQLTELQAHGIAAMKFRAEEDVSMLA
jgi:hypothetical protein